MTISDPRLRAMLRQADRVASAGKRAAAAQLYREIVEDAPDVEDAWLGLADVTFEEAEKEQALERVLEIDPENGVARRELAILRGEAPPPEPPDLVAAPPEAAPETAAAPSETAAAPPETAAAPLETAVSAPEAEPAPPELPPHVAVAPPAGSHDHHYQVEMAVETDVALVCYRHPERETSLRCYTCGKPICSQCAVKTPVGYSCPDCIRQKEDVFFNARLTDYLIATLAALPLSLLAGFLVLRFSGGFFFIFIMFFVGGLVGGFIGRIAKRMIGYRRGRYLPQLVAGIVILGVLLPALPVIVAIFLGSPGALFALLGPGIYLFTATGAAYYQMK